MEKYCKAWGIAGHCEAVAFVEKRRLASCTHAPRAYWRAYRDRNGHPVIRCATNYGSGAIVSDVTPTSWASCGAFAGTTVEDKFRRMDGYSVPLRKF